MAPGEVAGVPDQDQRHAVEAGAGDVDLAGDLQVGLEEALGPVPGEVRVAEHHSLAGPRRLPAEPVCVGADVDAQALVELAQLSGRRHRRSCRLGTTQRRCRRLGGRDSVDRHPLAGQQPELVEAAEGVDQRDRPHPLLTAAARVGKAGDAGLAQVAVVTGHVTACDLDYLGLRAPRRRQLQELLDRPLLDYLGEEEVAVEVVEPEAVAGEGPALPRSEEARALAADGHVGIGDRADVLAREGEPVAVSESPPRVGEDVRDAVLGDPDRRPQLRLATASGTLGGGSEQQRRCKHGCREPADAPRHGHASTLPAGRGVARRGIQRRSSRAIRRSNSRSPSNGRSRACSFASVPTR